MSRTEQKLDNLYDHFHELEKLVKKYQTIVQFEHNKILRIKKLTAQDFLFSQKKIGKVENELKQAAINLVLSCEDQKQALDYLIVNEDCLSEIGLEVVFRAISLNPRVWFKQIEDYTIEVIEKYRDPSEKYTINHLYALLIDLPDQWFLEESKFVKKLVQTLAKGEDAKLCYCIQLCLWQQNYSYPSVVEGIKQNLVNQDWRIRLITYEFLKVWKIEHNLRDLELPSPTIIDRIKARLNKGYELKLIE